MFGRKDDQLSPKGLMEREIATLKQEKSNLHAILDYERAEKCELQAALKHQRVRKDHSCYDDRAYVLRSVYDAEVARSRVRLDQIKSQDQTAADLQGLVDRAEHAERDAADLRDEVERLKLQLSCTADTLDTARIYTQGKQEIQVAERQLAVARRWNDRLKAGWRKQVARLYKRHDTLVDTMSRVQRMDKDRITVGELWRSGAASDEIRRLRARLERYEDVSVGASICSCTHRAACPRHRGER